MSRGTNEVVGGRTTAEIEDWLAGRFAEHLEVPRDQIKVDRPIIRYPIDSVDLAGITSDLLAWLDLRVETEELAERRTIADVARFLCEQAGPG